MVSICNTWFRVAQASLVAARVKAPDSSKNPAFVRKDS
jgi:hypothetical protein